MENKNNMIIACEILAESEAKAIIPAKIGVEQGVPASANTPPSKMG